MLHPAFLRSAVASGAASPLRESGGQARAASGPQTNSGGFGCAVRAGVHPTCLFLGNVTSAPGSQMASGVSLGSFNSRADGMQQRSYSVSSADQWSEATVIANSAVSSGKREARPRAPAAASRSSVVNQGLDAALCCERSRPADGVQPAVHLWSSCVPDRQPHPRHPVSRSSGGTRWGFSPLDRLGN